MSGVFGKQSLLYFDFEAQSSKQKCMKKKEDYERNSKHKKHYKITAPGKE
jgi:hypothetical protein